MFPGRVGLRNMFSLRGHVNKKQFQKDFGSGWVGQVSNWKFKKIGKHIFIHYFNTFLGREFERQ